MWNLTTVMQNYEHTLGMRGSIAFNAFRSCVFNCNKITPTQKTVCLINQRVTIQQPHSYVIIFFTSL